MLHLLSLLFKRIVRALMQPAHFAILLLLVGLILIVAEIFIPSGGVILFASLVSLGGSIWYAWRAWGESDSVYWWAYIASLVLGLPTAVGGAFYVFPRTSLGRRILLEAPSLDEVTAYTEEDDFLKKLIGKTGKTLTLLNPGGLVSVEGERLHCESEGMMLDAGQNVEVIRVNANRLVVRAVSKESPVMDMPEPKLEQTDDDPLDFELPQS